MWNQLYPPHTQLSLFLSLHVANLNIFTFLSTLTTWLDSFSSAPPLMGHRPLTPSECTVQNTMCFSFRLRKTFLPSLSTVFVFWRSFFRPDFDRIKFIPNLLSWYFHIICIVYNRIIWLQTIKRLCKSP